MVAYYPTEFNIPKIIRQYPELEMVNEDEEERLQDVIDRKKRGKGAPKKAKTKSASFLRLNPGYLALISSHCRRQSSFTQEAVMNPIKNSVQPITMPLGLLDPIIRALIHLLIVFKVHCLRMRKRLHLVRLVALT